MVCARAALKRLRLGRRKRYTEVRSREIRDVSRERKSVVQSNTKVVGRNYECILRKTYVKKGIYYSQAKVVVDE